MDILWTKTSSKVSFYLGFNLELEALRGALRWLQAGRVQGVLVRLRQSLIKLPLFALRTSQDYMSVTLLQLFDFILVEYRV